MSGRPEASSAASTRSVAWPARGGASKRPRGAASCCFAAAAAPASARGQNAGGRRPLHPPLVLIAEWATRGRARAGGRGVRCRAAGIYDDQGRLVAGLSVSAPADRLEESWLERVKETASRISAALGHSAKP